MGMGRPRLLAAGLLLASLVVAFSTVPASAARSPSTTRGGLPSCLTVPKPSPPLSRTQLTTLQHEVTTAVRANIESLTVCTGGPVFVTLLPGREWLAEELTATYGTKVSINVGFTHWGGQPGKSETCGDLAKPKPLPSGLKATFTPSSKAVVSGSDFRGTVRFTNRGSNGLKVTTGPSLAAYVVHRGTRRIVGAASSLSVPGLEPHVHTVEAGDSASAPAGGGTAQCDGGMGSTLPSGTYDLVIPFVIGRDEYFTPPVRIHVTTYRRPNP